MNNQSMFFSAACICGAIAVGMGAFGAHALKDRLEPKMLEAFEVGVRYQMYHAIAMLAISITSALWSSPSHSAWTGYACWAWLIGIVLFSGSLYALAITGVKGLGAITPLGGLAFIAGWLMLLCAAGSLKSY